MSNCRPSPAQRVIDPRSSGQVGQLDLCLGSIEPRRFYETPHISLFDIGKITAIDLMKLIIRCKGEFRLVAF